MASAEKYDLADFKAKVDKKHKEYRQARSNEAKEIAEAKNLKSDYEKMFKQ